MFLLLTYEISDDRRASLGSTLSIPLQLYRYNMPVVVCYSN